METKELIKNMNFMKSKYFANHEVMDEKVVDEIIKRLEELEELKSRKKR